MVSTWRFWSGKEINLSRRHPFQLLFVISIVLYVALRYSNVVALCGGVGLHVFRHLGASGLFVVAPAPQKPTEDPHSRSCRDRTRSV